MKRSFKKQLAIILGLITLLAGISALVQKYSTPQTSCYTKTSSFDKKLQDMLTTYENTVWQTLPVDRNAVEQHRKIEEQATLGYGNTLKNKPLQGPARAVVEEVIARLNMQDKNIAILATDKQTLAYSFSDAIIVNPKNFNRYSPIAQRFVIAHELGHIHFRDPHVKGIIGTHVRKKLKNAEPLLNNYSRFTEWRADIWACSHGPEFIEGYKTFCAENLKYFTDIEDTPTIHPLTK